MSNYTQTTFFAPKDALLTGNPLKLIKGADVDPEFAAIAAAITTKYDATNISSAPVGFADGTVNAPGITFAAQTNVGFFRIGTSDLGITVNGAQVVDFKTGVIVGAPAGGDKGAGTVNATGLFVNGVAVTPGAGGANPTALVGLTAVNGVATTFLRSDGAPALSQAIVPTWTGNHTFSGAGTPITAIAAAGQDALHIDNTGGQFTSQYWLHSGATKAEAYWDDTNTTIRIGAITGAGITALVSGGDTVRLSIAAAGNVTIAAPVSGTALTVTGFAASGVPALIVQGANSAGARGATIRGGTPSSADYALIVSDAGATNNVLLVQTNGAFSLGVLGNTLTGTSAGNVIITAPSSGAALSLPNTASAVALSGANVSLGVGTAFVAGASELYTSSTNVLNIGTAGAAVLGLYTNSLSRVAITSAGNVTIAAPSSGVALTITGVSGSTTAIFNDGGNGVPMTFNSTNAAGGYIAFQRGTINKAYIGDASQLSGGTLDDFTVRSEGGKLNLAISGVTKFSVVGSTAIQGWGPVAAALVDMTPDQGTFTMTFTGFTAGVTGTAVWSRNGNQVTLFIPAATGTSNATTMTATGIPAAINPARAQWCGFDAPGENNGIGAQIATRVDTGNTLTFGNGGAPLGTPNAWTNTGTKGVAAGYIVNYLLN